MLVGRLMWGALSCLVRGCGIFVCDCGIIVCDCGIIVRDCGIIVRDCGIIVRDCGIIELPDAPLKHRPTFARATSLFSFSDLVRTMANIVLRRANQTVLAVSKAMFATSAAARMLAKSAAVFCVRTF
jgi:hypothetical protein